MLTELEKRTRILRALWRKAYREDKPVDILFKTEKEARKVRFDLYNAVRGVRAEARLDPELAAAATGCTLSFPSPTLVRIAKRKVEDSLLDAAELYGINPEDEGYVPENIVEVEANDSFKRIQERLAAEAKAEEARKTPFVNPYGDATDGNSAELPKPATVPNYLNDPEWRKKP